MTCSRHSVSSGCRPRCWWKNFLTSAGAAVCTSSKDGQRSKNSHANSVSSLANHSSICGKYPFRYPVRRFSCAVFPSTSLRRSSTRFCPRRVASLSGVKRRSLSRCCRSRSSSRSASRGSSLAPDGYSASRMLADIVDGTGYRCRHSYLPSMYTSADRKSTRLNSSHQIISYAVFCLKKKKKQRHYGRHIMCDPLIFVKGCHITPQYDEQIHDAICRLYNQVAALIKSRRLTDARRVAT